MNNQISYNHLLQPVLTIFVLFTSITTVFMVTQLNNHFERVFSIVTLIVDDFMAISHSKIKMQLCMLSFAIQDPHVSYNTQPFPMELLANILPSPSDNALGQVANMAFLGTVKRNLVNLHAGFALVFTLFSTLVSVLLSAFVFALVAFSKNFYHQTTI